MNKFEILDKKIDEYAEREGFSGVIRVTVKDKIVYEKSVGYYPRMFL